jgi:hypothetical protein
VSASFVANDDFFGQAIARILGRTKSQVHEVVETIGWLVHRIRPSI